MMIVMMIVMMVVMMVVTVIVVVSRAVSRTYVLRQHAHARGSQDVQAVDVHMRTGLASALSGLFYELVDVPGRLKELRQLGECWIRVDLVI